MLDTIERVGNKVPHPAIIFIILIAGVIVLSQILYIAGASVTYEVVVPPTVEAEQGYPAGSAVEVPDVPVEDFDTEDMHIETETTAVQGLLTADGIRFMVTSPVANFNNFGVVGIILVAMLGVGLAEEAGLIGALIRLARPGLPGAADHVHHRADRHPLEHRHRCRLPRPHPAGGRGLPQHGPASAGRSGGRVRRGRRRPSGSTS